MTRVFAILALSMILLQSLLLPLAVKAQGDPEPPCPITADITFTTLPATDITSTTAVFNGRLCETVRGLFNSKKLTQPDSVYPVYFEYGTAPGVYDNRVNAEMGAMTITEVPDGEDIVLRLCVSFKATVQNLRPCSTYYVRLRFIESFMLGPVSCITIHRAGELSFMTIGCTVGSGSHGAGGMGVIAPATRPFQMSNIIVKTASISSTKVSPGEQVEVTANMVNQGGSNGDAKVTLYVNGQEVESKGVALGSGANSPVRFYVSRNEPGTYSVYVGGTSAGTFAVDVFTNNDILIYSLIGLFSIAIAGVLYLVTRKQRV